MKQFALLTLLLLGGYAAFSQNITHGPVVGGLTESGARIYVRTHQASPIEIQYSLDSLFSTFTAIPDSTIPERDTTAIFTLPFLQPNTEYFYRISVGGTVDVKKGSFRTFPVVGATTPLRFATGSCQETANMKVFDVINRRHPNLFLHLGDFTYPSYQLDNSYPANYPTVQLAWRRRYEEIKMREMLYNVPIDYINDDDDGWAGSKYVLNHTYFDSINGQLVNHITGDSIPEIHRTNVKRAYMEYFPGYSIPDTSVALYHSFIAGNCEFFFIDTRNDRDCENEAFIYNPDSNKWFFMPDTNHRIISQTQMNWLKNGLANSTADWKIIAGGVPFNKNMRRLIEVGMRLQGYAFSLSSQGVNSTGLHLALGFADYWPGYPASQMELLNFIHNQHVKDVVFISGDTHHNVMDDGRNGGLPELNASGMSVSTTSLAYYLNLYAPVFGEPSVHDSIWNQGGNGLGNMNLKNAFGEFNVFGKDSMQMCVIDEDDTAISCFTILNSSIIGEKEIAMPDNAMKLFPVPSFERLFVEIADNYDVHQMVKTEVFDVSGKKLLETKENGGLIMISTQDLSPGTYMVKSSCNGKQWVKKFMKL